MIPVESVAVHAFEFPTDGPDGQEHDGTLTWSSTVLILVETRDPGRGARRRPSMARASPLRGTDAARS
jgi:hypothetical protein